MVRRASLAAIVALPLKLRVGFLRVRVERRLKSKQIRRELQLEKGWDTDRKFTNRSRA